MNDGRVMKDDSASRQLMLRRKESFAWCFGLQEKNNMKLGVKALANKEAIDSLTLICSDAEPTTEDFH